MLIEAIKAHLASKPEDRDRRAITISKLGSCIKKLAYEYTGQKGDPLDWKAQMVFDDGRVGHDQLRSFLRLAGGSTFILAGEEQEVTYVYKGLTVKGHVDGLIKLPTQEICLLELKTMGDYAYERMEKGEELDYTYMIQIQAYMASLGLKRCFFVAKNKGTGDLYEREIPFSSVELEACAERILGTDMTKPDAIERPYGFDAKGKLDWHCGYCSMRSICWKGVPMHEVKNRRNVFVKA